MFDAPQDDDQGEGWFHQEQLLRQQFEDEQYRLELLHTKRKIMGLIASTSSSRSQRAFELPPSGAFAARCYRVIDLGTQTFTVQGELKQAHQALISWELGKKMSDGNPFTISEKYTVSLNEKARLRGILESWRGKPFSSRGEKENFSLREILGKVCFVNIVHNTKGDRTYANVASVMPLPEGVPPPEKHNDTLIFDLDAFDQDIFDRVPEYFKGMIVKTPEFQSINSAATEEDSEIPF